MSLELAKLSLDICTYQQCFCKLLSYLWTDPSLLTDGILGSEISNYRIKLEAHLNGF